MRPPAKAITHVRAIETLYTRGGRPQAGNEQYLAHDYEAQFHRVVAPVRARREAAEAELAQLSSYSVDPRIVRRRKTLEATIAEAGQELAAADARRAARGPVLEQLHERLPLWRGQPPSGRLASRAAMYFRSDQAANEEAFSLWEQRLRRITESTEMIRAVVGPDELREFLDHRGAPALTDTVARQVLRGAPVIATSAARWALADGVRDGRDAAAQEATASRAVIRAEEQLFSAVTELRKTPDHPPAGRAGAGARAIRDEARTRLAAVRAASDARLAWYPAAAGEYRNATGTPVGASVAPRALSTLNEQRVLVDQVYGEFKGSYEGRQTWLTQSPRWFSRPQQTWPGTEGPRLRRFKRGGAACWQIPSCHRTFWSA
jgi:hypothetical protein